MSTVTKCAVLWTLCLFGGVMPIWSQEMIADIQQDVPTEFGVYHPYLVTITPNAEPYIVAPDFSNVVNFNEFTFSENEKALLRQNYFVVSQREGSFGVSGFKQLYDIYNQARDLRQPVFVTTDAMLHTFHILYDYALRIMEYQKFIDDLDRLNKALIATAEAHYQTATDARVKEAARKNVAYFAVATKLLDEAFSVPDYVQNLVTQELALIAAHPGYQPSPIFEYREDYSQYQPRGHYTRSASFEKYFKAMMWYGRITFALESEFLSAEQIRELTRGALLVVQALYQTQVETEPALTVWDRIYTPTVFFVGRADDLTAFQYAELMRQIYGANFPDLPVDTFGDDSLLAQFQAAAEDLPDPAIDTIAGKGFRLMGQRFVPDSYMLDQLVDPHVKDRWMPKGLDVMTILGSNRAWAILDQVYQETTNPSYVAKMDSLKQTFDTLPDSTWAQNLYWNWLYCLMPLLFEKGTGYPVFMQNLAWQDKELATALASWAELRHDTILYAKQSESWRGGHPAPEFQQGYVEPNPHFYARLAALCSFIKNGLANLGLLLPEFDWRFIKLEQVLLWFKTISEKELTNQIPTTEEYHLILNIGQIMEELTTFPPELAGQIENQTDDAMAVIADVHTLIDRKSLCLEEGVGYPLDIFVLVAIEGQVKVTRGGVFSYYEFEQPIENRLSDEDWQKLQTGPDPKPMPVWTASFVDTSRSRLNPNPGHHFSVAKTEVSHSGAMTPEKFQLSQNYPNPFNQRTVISYQLSVNSWVRIFIYNLQGQLVRMLIDEVKESGYHTVAWDGTDERGLPLPSGVYFYRLEARATSLQVQDGYVKVKKLIVLK